ncbi:MAG: cell envelope biogenesis protein OmpA [Candidatus Adiutrix sp.]|jgi:outer membrane lipoprotein SlyB|nr:cell envelope biogenesis protein OmpA [Candidatus Adiutrix sp.]
MKKIISLCLMAALVLMPAACTNMTKTQQGAVSGAAGGALLGATIAAVTGGHGSKGAIIGAVAGGLGGAIVGDMAEKNNQPAPAPSGPAPGYTREYQPPAKN